jgi:hypothetical protein
MMRDDSHLREKPLVGHHRYLNRQIVTECEYRCAPPNYVIVFATVFPASAAAIRLTDSLAATAGVGAIARTARASGLAIPSVNRPVKTPRKVG